MGAMNNKKGKDIKKKQYFQQKTTENKPKQGESPFFSFNNSTSLPFTASVNGVDLFLQNRKMRGAHRQHGTKNPKRVKKHS